MRFGGVESPIWDEVDPGDQPWGAEADGVVVDRVILRRLGWLGEPRVFAQLQEAAGHVDMWNTCI